MTRQQKTVQGARRPPGPSESGRPAGARGRRTGPVAGLLGLACFAVGSLIAGLPMPGSPTGLVLAHLTASRSAVLGGTLLMFLSLPFLLAFLSYFVSLLARAEGSRPLAAAWTAGAWLMLFTVIAAGTIPLAAIAWQGSAAAPPALVRLAFDIYSLSLYALSAPVAAASVLAPSVVIWRTRLLPRWLVWVGLLEVGSNIIELAGMSATKGADAAGYAAGIGPLAWIIWATAISGAALAARPAPSAFIGAAGVQWPEAQASKPTSPREETA
jgi:hypothetical protein